MDRGCWRFQEKNTKATRVWCKFKCSFIPRVQFHSISEAQALFYVFWNSQKAFERLKWWHELAIAKMHKKNSGKTMLWPPIFSWQFLQKRTTCCLCVPFLFWFCGWNFFFASWTDHLLVCFSKYQRVIMANDSVVKIPDDVRRDRDDIFDTVKWTAKLDRVFRANQKQDPSLRWVRLLIMFTYPALSRCVNTRMLFCAW